MVQRFRDSSELLTCSLADRINADVSQLLQRFENIMATATVCLRTRSCHTFKVLKITRAGGEPQLHIDRCRDLSVRRRVNGTGMFFPIRQVGQALRIAQLDEYLIILSGGVC